MRYYTTRLGGVPVRIVAPGIGELDPAGALALLGDSVLGLDVESRYLRDAGPWDPDFGLRLVQFATEHAALVLRMDDPEQRAFACRVLSDPGRELVSHTQIDPIAVWCVLGVDVTDRMTDTHWLSIMSQPDDRAGQAKLKPVAARFGMPELLRADERLAERFDELYRADHPGIGRRAVSEAHRDAHGFDSVPIDDPVYVAYAGLDAITARRLVQPLASATGAPPSLLAAERWLSQQVTKIRIRGHRVDREALASLSASTAAVVEDVSAIVGDITGLTPTQTVRLQGWLGEHMAGGWPESHPRTPTGAPKIGKDFLGKIAGYDLDDEGKVVADALKRHADVLNRKVVTTAIGHSMIEGRIHPTIYSIGTITGRMSSSNPNMQNFAKKDSAMRGLFLPEPGHVLVSCDFAQIELRVLAALAGEQSMIDTIMSGGDLHQLTADLLGIGRQEAKTVNFLIVYGGGGGELAEQLGWSRPVEECAEIIRTYWRQYPAIAELRDQVSRRDHVRLLSGRRIPLSLTKDGREATWAMLNYLIQGNARDLLAGAWRTFADTVPGGASMVWLPIHDELVLDVPADRLDEVAAGISAAMTFPYFGVPVAADADVLLDRDGTSRWMSGDRAAAIAAERAITTATTAAM